MTVRLLWRTDVHVRDQSPESRIDHWPETVASKLRQVGELARQYECLGVLDGGDFFDDKTPIRTSHRMVSDIAHIHAGYPCPTYANVGNHDVRLAQLSNLEESPLETLFATGVFHRLYNEHEARFETGDVVVRVVGVPYHGPRYDLSRFRNIRRGAEDWLVCCAHVLASPQGGEMFSGEDILKYEDLPGLMPDVDVILFGHWHKNQGIQQVRGKWIVNVGSMTRGALTQDNINREPGVVLLQFPARGHELSLSFEKLEIRPASEVFDMVKRVREEARAMTVDAFIHGIQEALAVGPKGSIEDAVTAMASLPARVRERALHFLEKARR